MRDIAHSLKASAGRGAQVPAAQRAVSGLRDQAAGAETGLTPAEAQQLQNEALGLDTWIAWLVSTSDPDHPGKAVAWGVAADPSGGARIPGLLVADTLDGLRAMLPEGLTRAERASVMPEHVVETWD